MTASPMIAVTCREMHKIQFITKYDPVLSLMSPLEKMHNNENLRRFALCHLLGEKAPPTHTPVTLTHFCGRLLDFRLKPIYRLLSSEEVKLILLLEQKHILDVLSELAFNEFIHHKHITDASLAVAFKSLLKKHNVSGSKEIYDTLRMGLMEVDESTKIGCYKFTELWLQYYLVARHQTKLLFDRISNGQRFKIHSDLEESMDKLPRTIDIWAMTFGLMSEDWNLCGIQQKVMKHIREHVKGREDMPSVSLSAFLCQCVYESWNHGRLIELLDDFTFNQMINFRTLNLPYHRVQYMLSALGYVIPIAHGLYGVVLSRFGLNGRIVGRLTEPSNSTSEVHLSLVDLSYNQLGALGMRQLQRFMVKASSISYLNLSHTDLGLQGTIVLAKLLMCMPLVSLSISGNEMTDNGLAEILKNLKYCYTLESLDISENLLTHFSSFILCEHLASSAPELHRLDISRNYLNSAQVDNIKAAVRRLEAGQKRCAVELEISDQREGDAPRIELSETLFLLLPARFRENQTPSPTPERRPKSVMRRSLVCGGTAERMKVIYDIQRHRRGSPTNPATGGPRTGTPSSLPPTPRRHDLFH